MKIIPLKTKLRGVAGLILLLGIDTSCFEEEKPRIESRGKVIYEDRDMAYTDQGEIFLKQQIYNPVKKTYNFTGNFFRVLDLDEEARLMKCKGIKTTTKQQ